MAPTDCAAKTSVGASDTRSPATDLSAHEESAGGVVLLTETLSDERDPPPSASHGSAATAVSESGIQVKRKQSGSRRSSAASSQEGADQNEQRKRRRLVGSGSESNFVAVEQTNSTDAKQSQSDAEDQEGSLSRSADVEPAEMLHAQAEESQVGGVTEPTGVSGLLRKGKTITEGSNAVRDVATADLGTAQLASNDLAAHESAAHESAANELAATDMAATDMAATDLASTVSASTGLAVTKLTTADLVTESSIAGNLSGGDSAIGSVPLGEPLSSIAETCSVSSVTVIHPEDSHSPKSSSQDRKGPVRTIARSRRIRKSLTAEAQIASEVAIKNGTKASSSRKQPLEDLSDISESWDAEWWRRQLGDNWWDALQDRVEAIKDKLTLCLARVRQMRQKHKVFPPEDLVFNAFKTTPLSDVKVVIMGQDPYHQEGQAMGLSFSVADGVRIPPSLSNMLKEIDPTTRFLSGDLTHWARQGVLLLNSILTVTESKPNSHKSFGWGLFTDAVVDLINLQKQNIVFLLWGNDAKEKGKNIDRTRHHVLEAGHPSPLSIRHFKGCDHFNLANTVLKNLGLSEIDWRLPEKPPDRNALGADFFKKWMLGGASQLEENGMKKAEVTPEGVVATVGTVVAEASVREESVKHVQLEPPDTEQRSSVVSLDDVKLRESSGMPSSVVQFVIEKSMQVEVQQRVID